MSMSYTCIAESEYFYVVGSILFLKIMTANFSHKILRGQVNNFHYILILFVSVSHFMLYLWSDS